MVCGVSVGNVGEGGGGDADEVGGGDFDLETPDAGTDVDVGVLCGGVVDVGGVVLFHTDGSAASADVAGCGQEVFHRYQVALFVAAYCRGFFQVDFFVAGYDTYEVPAPVAKEYQSFEHLLYRLAQFFCHMGGRQVVFVDGVGD